MAFSNNLCFICEAEVLFGADTSLIKSRQNVCQKFKVLVSRFLNFDCRMGSDSQTLNINFADNPNKEESVCCFTCFPAIESFCDIYKNWECLKLELFHSLDRISERTTSPANNFKEEFIRKVETKRQRHYPYLQLSKLNKSEIPRQLNSTSTAVKYEAVDVYQDEEDDSIHSENEMPTHLNAIADVVKAEAVDVYHQHEDDDSINYPDFSDPIKESFNIVEDNQELDEREEKVKCESNETISNISEDYCIIKIKCEDDVNEPNIKSKPVVTLKRKKRVREKKHCVICGKLVLSSNLMPHTLVHTNEKPFHCRICQGEFVTKAYLSHHKKYQHFSPGGRPSVECKICGKFFKNISAHRFGKHGRKKWHCPTCKKGFTSRYELNRHKKIHSSGYKGVECDICCKMVKNIYSHRKVHLNLKDGAHEKGTILNHDYDDQDGICIGKTESAQPAEISTKNSKTNTTTLNNRKTRRKSRNHNCMMCEETFLRSCELFRHTLVHTHEKPYFCQICPEEFARKDGLSSHVKRRHSFTVRHANPGTKCNICGRIVTHIQSHLQRVHTPGNLACNICKKRFHGEFALKRHQNVHSEFRNFSCDICDKKFKHQREIPRHKKLQHSANAGVQCDICGKVVLHIRLHRIYKHSSVRKYVCGICEKGFVTQYKLKIHQRTHSKKGQANISG